MQTILLLDLWQIYLSHRTGGTHRRFPGENFDNTFQGKLSQHVTYQVLK